MDKVEEVARAISEAIAYQDDLAHYSYEQRKEKMDEVARAAIEAMRVPADKQVAIGVSYANWPHDGSHNALMRSCYTAMIDAALSGKE